MTNHQEILQFIRFRFWANEQDSALPAVQNLFTRGACYYFAIILKERFPSLEIWYDEIEGHFEVSLPNDNIAFDINGSHERSAASVQWDQLKQIDSLHAARIERDCIL